MSRPAASAVLLAGGASRRMGGVPKAFLRVGRREILQRVLEAVAPVCADLVLVANDAEAAAGALARYGWREAPGGFAPTAQSSGGPAFGCKGATAPASAADGPRAVRLRLVPDRRAGEGPLAGIEAGLLAIRAPAAWVVACDLPFVRPALGRLLLGTLAGGVQSATQRSGGARPAPPTAVAPLAAVARWDGRPQPLCATYAREAGRVAAACLDAGVRRVEAFLERLALVPVPDEPVRALGDPGRLFLNVNTPADLQRARALAADDGDWDGDAPD